MQSNKCYLDSIYGTDLTQRRAPSRVLGYHSRGTRTRPSICFSGLELDLNSSSNEN